MVSRTLPVAQWSKHIDLWNSILPGGKGHHRPIAYPIKAVAERFGHGDFRMPFTDAENQRGTDWLVRRGWSPGEPFVCLLVRDDAFLQSDPTVKQTHPKSDQERWAYHSYRDSDVLTYLPAMEWLAEQGVWILRMGKRMNQPLRTRHARIVDYAFEDDRCDFLDIWLFANCTACISTGTGPDTISAMYGRPILYLNYIPMAAYANYSASLTVPKKLMWQGSAVELRLSEYLSHAYIRTDQYEGAGITIVDLNPREILEAVQEFWLRLNHLWSDREADQHRHQAFWNVVTGTDDWKTRHGTHVSHDIRVGSAWLASKGTDFFGETPADPPGARQLA